MKNVTITEGGTGYMPGSLEHQLRSNGFLPTMISGPGVQPQTYRVQANEQQISFLKQRYFSHRIEVEEDAPPAEDARDLHIRELTAANTLLRQQMDRLAAEPPGLPLIETVARLTYSARRDKENDPEWEQAPAGTRERWAAIVSDVYSAVEQAKAGGQAVVAA